MAPYFFTLPFSQTFVLFRLEVPCHPLRRISYIVGLLAVFISLLGSGCSAKPITSTQPSTVTQVPTPQTPAVDKDGVNTPSEASSESKERDREMDDDRM